jgi:hypothetical protein
METVTLTFVLVCYLGFLAFGAAYLYAYFVTHADGLAQRLHYAAHVSIAEVKRATQTLRAQRAPLVFCGIVTRTVGPSVRVLRTVKVGA